MNQLVSILAAIGIILLNILLWGGLLIVWPLLRYGIHCPHCKKFHSARRNLESVITLNQGEVFSKTVSEPSGISVTEYVDNKRNTVGSSRSQHFKYVKASFREDSERFKFICPKTSREFYVDKIVRKRLN